MRNLKILSWRKSFQPLVLSASCLSYLSLFVEWILYLILLLEIWLKPKFIYLYIWNTYLLSSFSSLFFTLPLIRERFFLCLFFQFFFKLFKQKLFYQYLLGSLRKQQLRDILLNIYFFNLINFTKLFSH